MFFFFFFFLFAGGVGISRAKGFEAVRFWDELGTLDATNIIIQKMDTNALWDVVLTAWISPSGGNRR
jgi:hypothetical protein